MRRWWLVGVCLVGLAACAGPLGGQGDPSPGAAKRAQCERACNRDYDVCADGAGARRGGSSFFGMGAACDRQAKECLAGCKALTVQPKAKEDGKAEDKP